MTNTIPNVPRELLERAWRALANSATGREIGAYLDADPCAPECAETCARASMCSTCSAILSAPSPAGVDGLKRYEVFPYLDDEVAEMDICESDDGSFVKYDDAQAIIDGLRGEVARLQRAEKNDAIAYKAALERQDELRTERDQHAKRIGELEGLLLRVQVSLSLDDTEWGYSGAEKYKLLADIRAALSAGKDSDQ